MMSMYYYIPIHKAYIGPSYHDPYYSSSGSIKGTWDIVEYIVGVCLFIFCLKVMLDFCRDVCRNCGRDDVVVVYEDQRQPRIDMETVSYNETFSDPASLVTL